MKKSFYRLCFSLVAIFTIVSFGSCLKDQDYIDGKTQADVGEDGGVQNTIYIGLTATGTSNQTQWALDNSPNDTTLNAIPVILGGGSPAKEDINVTLSINTAALGDYGYEEFPTSYYTVTNQGDSANGYIVTIPKGKNVGYLTVTVNPGQIIGHNFALGVQITKIQQAGYFIASNLNTGACGIMIKNKYDGHYTLRIKTTGWGAYAISDNLPGDWPNGVDVVTTGANTVTFSTSSGIYQIAFTPDNAGGAYFGAATPLYTFDLSTDKLTNVVNTTPDDGRGRAFALNPAVTDSRYDPSTKTIYAAYLMKQNGRPNMYIYDTLVYQKSR